MPTSLIPADQLPHTIPDAFASVARRASAKLAMQIKDGDHYRQYTYGELAQAVEKLAASLVKLGLRVGQRVAIVAENRPEWAMVYLAVVTVGGTAVPIDFQMPPDEISTLLGESESRLVFVTAQTQPLIQQFPPGSTLITMDTSTAPHQLALQELLTGDLGKREVDSTVRPDDIASLLYTSGTTKRPKGVLLSHANLTANAKALMITGLAGHEDTFLVMLPLHHAYPFMIAFLVPLLLGARMTFLQSLKGPDLLQCIRDTHITMLVGVPQVFAMIRRAILDEVSRRPGWARGLFHIMLALSGSVRRLTGWNLGRVLFAPLHRKFGESLRILCSGGARLEPEVATLLTGLGFTIREGYGLTETSPVIAFNPLGRPKHGSVGLPLSQVEVRIVDPNERGIGEVAVRGPNVMKGYDRNPSATAEVIRSGWFYTGDLGYLDREGYLFLTGRLKELIVLAGGKNIHPEELEARYQQSPAINEVCVIGLPTENDGGEHLHAVVVPNLDYLKARRVHDVLGHIKDELTTIALTLAPHKRVTGVSIVKEPFPRTRLGKIKRHLVTAKVATVSMTQEGRPVLTDEERKVFNTETARCVLEAITSLHPARTSIHPNDHIEIDLGFDSLRRVEMLTALESRFGRLPDSLSEGAITVRDLIAALDVLQIEQRDISESKIDWREILESAPPYTSKDNLRGESNWFDRVALAIGIALMSAALRIAFRLRVEGREHIPQHGAFLLAANHVSYLDPFVLLVALPRGGSARLYTLGWEAYFRTWFLGWAARVVHVIPVGTEAPLVSVLRTSAMVLRKGKGLLVFPEGERSIDGKLLPFKKGIGMLACELGIPVIPTWIQGTFEAWPPDAALPRFRPIQARFGEPLRVTNEMKEGWVANGDDPHEAASDLIRTAVADLGQAGRVQGYQIGRRESGAP